MKSKFANLSNLLRDKSIDFWCNVASSWINVNSLKLRLYTYYVLFDFRLLNLATFWSVKNCMSSNAIISVIKELITSLVGLENLLSDKCHHFSIMYFTTRQMCKPYNCFIEGENFQKKITDFNRTLFMLEPNFISFNF